MDWKILYHAQVISVGHAASFKTQNRISFWTHLFFLHHCLFYCLSILDIVSFFHSVYEYFFSLANFFILFSIFSLFIFIFFLSFSFWFSAFGKQDKVARLCVQWTDRKLVILVFLFLFPSNLFVVINLTVRFTVL